MALCHQISSLFTKWNSCFHLVHTAIFSNDTQVPFIEYTQLSICLHTSKHLQHTEVQNLKHNHRNGTHHMNDNDWRISHFFFCKLSQCRPTFFIVKHKTAHKKVYFSTHREQYSTDTDSMIMQVTVWTQRGQHSGLQ